MLKQLLLLLLRMLAVAAVVLLVAQPVLQNQWGNLLGGTRTHHIVLLDDSFSMSDRWADTDAFVEAKRIVQRIGPRRPGRSIPNSSRSCGSRGQGRAGAPRNRICSNSPLAASSPTS